MDNTELLEHMKKKFLSLASMNFKPPLPVCIDRLSTGLLVKGYYVINLHHIRIPETEKYLKDSLTKYAAPLIYISLNGHAQSCNTK